MSIKSINGQILRHSIKQDWANFIRFKLNRVNNQIGSWHRESSKRTKRGRRLRKWHKIWLKHDSKIYKLMKQFRKIKYSKKN